MNKNIVIVLIVAIVAIIVVFLVAQNKKTTQPISTIQQPTNSFGFSLPSFGFGGSSTTSSTSSQPVSAPSPSDEINGMTRDEYLAAGYTQDEVNAIFNYRPAK